MVSNADARCPCCGAQEPDWNGSHADPAYFERDAALEAKDAELASLKEDARASNALAAENFARAKKAEAENAKLRAALEPLSKVTTWRDTYPDADHDRIVSAHPIELMHVHAARKLLACEQTATQGKE